MSIKPNWDLLLDTICPICQDNKLVRKDGVYVCEHHKYPIKIKEEKFNSIVSKIEEREAPFNFFSSL